MIKPRVISVLYGRICYYALISPLILILYACPFSSPYKLDNESSIPVDETLLGKWATMLFSKKGNQLPVKMILTRKNDTEYYIDLTGNFNDLKPYRVARNDSIHGSACLSNVGNRQLLSIEIKGQTYIAAIVYNNDTLSLLPLADGFTAKYIRSNTDLRKAVDVHLRTRLFPKYDEQFCLRGMVRVN